jgi:RNA recognition motif-containing protein
MSDAPAAPVPESGVPPVAQDSETPVVTPGFKVIQFPILFPLSPLNSPRNQVFAGNLAHSTTDEGLRAFFAPVQGDMSARSCLSSLPPAHFLLPIYSISAQVIRRGFRDHGRPPSYGFVAFTTIEAAQEAVETLNNEELDGRSIIVEIARPMEEKDREYRPRRFKKYHHSGRRGPKSVPGEVTDAEANDGTTDKAEAAPAVEGAEKPKKKKKKHPVCIVPLFTPPSS